MNSTYLYVGIYILILLGISIFLGYKGNDQDFLIAGRDRKRWQIMLSKFATSVGASWFITYTGYTYFFGYSAMMILPGFIIGYIIFSYVVIPALFKKVGKSNFYTQGDYIQSQTGSIRDKQIIDIFGIVISSMWLLISVIAGAKVLEFVGILSYELAVILTSIVVLLYIIISGYKAVVITDAIQTIMIFIFFAITTVYIFNTVEIGEVFIQETHRMSIATMIGFFVYGIFSLFSLPDRFQLTFAADSEKEAKVGMLWALIPIIIMMVFLLIIGLLMFGENPSINRDMVFILFFFDYLPETFFSIGSLLFFAGIMSSVDTGVYNTTSYIGYLFGSTGNKVFLIRILSVILVFLMMVSAFLFRDIIAINLVAAGMTLVPSIPMLYCVLGGDDSTMFRVLFLGGSGGLILAFFLVGITPNIALFPLVFAGLFAGIYKFYILFSRYKKRNKLL